MLSIDPQLMLLREVEARIAFAESHIEDQRRLVARLSAAGFPTSLAHDLLRSMEDSLSILRRRRDDMLCSLQPTPLHAAPVLAASH